MPDHSLTESAIERLHREMDAKDAQIEELEGALRDALALLPPDRWRLLLPRFAAVRVETLENGRSGGDPS